MDCIKLTGIRGYGYTGYLEEERTLGQWFEVDLTIWADLHPSGKSDAIADTLDYRKAVSLTQHLLKTAKFALVEKLASAIADAILDLKYAKRVRVQLSKPAAPIPDFDGNITIDIIRPD